MELLTAEFPYGEIHSVYTVMKDLCVWEILCEKGERHPGDFWDFKRLLGKKLGRLLRESR